MSQTCEPKSIVQTQPDGLKYRSNVQTQVQSVRDASTSTQVTAAAVQTIRPRTSQHRFPVSGFDDSDQDGLSDSTKPCPVTVSTVPGPVPVSTEPYPQCPVHGGIFTDPCPVHDGLHGRTLYPAATPLRCDDRDCRRQAANCRM